ncbi:MAG: hypothetical protein LBL15_07965, partial [Oscillospiraceae bacterium]|nr:hypothetical protein [Oscillospiraceae bacterium]
MKKRFSRAVLFLLVLSLCTFAFGIISFAEGETPEIHWSFESGELDPFTVTEGAFGAKIIANWDRDRNNLTTGQLVGKDGTYYLCTVETDGTTAYNEAYRGTIQSPVFQILDPTITMKLAGGPNAANYVAVCRYSDDAELARVTKPGAGSHIFAAATLTIPNDKYVAGEAVYLKIVDGTTSNWAFISVDDIRVKGELYTGVVADVKWSFEDGTTAPFTYVKGNVGKPIGNRDTEMNSPKASILKDGTYYLTTVEKTAETADDAMTAEFRSPNFTLSKPVIKFKLAGGAVAGCYVALCMKSGAELARVSPAASRYIFQERSIDTSSLGLEPETQVFLKIVDSASGGWAFIAVDDIRFTGQVVEDPVVDIRFDFENGGALEPWRMISGNVETYIGSRDVDFNGGVPMQKQGTYYLTSVEKDNGNSNDDRFTGVFRSPVFTVDVENDPVVKFKIGGGASTSDLYMAIRRKPAGDLVAKTTSSRNLYVFEERQIDLTGLVTKYDQLYIEVVDNRTAGWGCIIFDDFRARGTFPPELPLSSEAEVAELTGWTAARFSQLKLPIQDLVDTYGGAYPRGAEYLSEIVEKEALHKSFWQEGYLPNDPAVESFKAEMDAL